MADPPCPPESISKQAEDLRKECSKHQWVVRREEWRACGYFSSY